MTMAWEIALGIKQFSKIILRSIKNHLETNLSKIIQKILVLDLCNRLLTRLFKTVIIVKVPGKKLSMKSNSHKWKPTIYRNNTTND